MQRTSLSSLGPRLTHQLPHQAYQTIVLEGIPTTRWKQASDTKRCGVCVRRFSLFRRKHHCRACGDVCCRRCLSPMMVDVPMQGVQLAHTCGRCLFQQGTLPAPREYGHRSVSREASVVRSTHSTRNDPADISPSHHHSPGPYTLQRGRSRSLPTPPASESSPTVPRSPHAPYIISSALTPCEPPEAWVAQYKVTVSQHDNVRLQSVCSLVEDYLDCKSCAIVLLEDDFVWVVAYHNLRVSMFHSDEFLSLCRHSSLEKSSYSFSQPLDAHLPGRSRETFQFVASAPLSDQSDPWASSYGIIGCVFAFDTKPRSDLTSSKVVKTLDYLGQLIMDMLAAEKTILRLYQSGEFKIFESNALDLTPDKKDSIDTFRPTALSSETSEYKSIQAESKHPRGSAFLWSFSSEVKAAEPPSYSFRLSSSDEGSISVLEDALQRDTHSRHRFSSMRRDRSKSTRAA